MLYTANNLSFTVRTSVMRCAIWYHLYNFKKVKNTHGGVLILVKLQATKQSNVILFYFVGWLYHALSKLANHQLLSYHINMIPSNILSYILSIIYLSSSNTGSLSMLLKQNMEIWEASLCSRHLSITNTILRSQCCPLQRAFTVLIFTENQILFLFSRIFMKKISSFS